MQTLITKILPQTGDVAPLYRNLIASLTYSSQSPHEFVRTAYDHYRGEFSRSMGLTSNPSVNGRIFEYLICEVLSQSELPYYYQAEVDKVPNAKFDILLYNETAPIVLSAKVSLRERYKQADLESWVLKQVYRNAETYLITLNAGEARNVAKKIAEGGCPGLSQCIVGGAPEFSQLIARLRESQRKSGNEGYGRAQPRPPAVRGKFV